jgi:hypothetical protein
MEEHRSSFALTLSLVCVVNSFRGEGIESACYVLPWRGTVYRQTGRFCSKTESKFVIFHFVMGLRVASLVAAVLNIG